MVIKVIGTDKLVNAFVEMIDEYEWSEDFSFAGESKYSLGSMIGYGSVFWATNNENLGDWISKKMYDMQYTLPEDWDKAFKRLKQESIPKGKEAEELIKEAQCYFSTKIMEEQLKNQLIREAKGKGYTPMKWIWNGDKFEQIDWNAKGYEYDYNNDILYLNGTCIYEDGRWKLLMEHGEIYRAFIKNEWWIFRYRKNFDQQIYPYSYCVASSIFVPCNGLILEGMIDLDKASKEQKVKLEKFEKQEGSKWNGSELIKIKPQLFGHDVIDHSGVVDIGCKKNISKHLLNAIIVLCDYLKDGEVVEIDNGSITFVDGTNKETELKSDIKNVLKQLS